MWIGRPKNCPQIGYSLWIAPKCPPYLSTLFSSIIEKFAKKWREIKILIKKNAFKPGLKCKIRNSNLKEALTYLHVMQSVCANFVLRKFLTLLTQTESGLATFKYSMPRLDAVCFFV